MWTRYRKWKRVVVLPLAALALWLMRGKPDESARCSAGIFIAALLVIAYLVEEIVWIHLPGLAARH
jgi:hypothetical protein